MQWLLLTMLFVVGRMGWLQSDEPMLAIHAPTAMNGEELAVVADVLTLAEAQRLLFASRAADYQAEAQQLMAARMPELEHCSRNAAAGIAHGDYDSASVAWLESLRKAERELKEAMARIDAAFFADIERVLSPFQGEAMPSVRLRRQRQFADPRRRDLPSAGIDLVVFLRDARIDEHAWGPLDSVLREYDVVVTPVWLEFEIEVDRASIRDAKITHEQQRDASQNGPPENPLDAEARVEAFRQKKRQVLEAPTRLLERLDEINSRYLKRVLEFVPDPAARRRIEMSYRSAVQFKVHPDPLDPATILTPSTIVGLPQPSLDAMMAILERHSREWEGLSRDMEKEFTRWRLQFAGTLSGVGYPDHRHQMRLLRTKRWELDVRTTREALLLLAQSTSTLVPALEGLLRRAEQTMAQAETDSYPGMY